jgi:hypothetical protein
MSDVTVLFSMFWAGSNQQIASRVPWCYNLDTVCEQDADFRTFVARFVNTTPFTRSFKITLGSPAGPQLTYALYSRPYTLRDTRAKNEAMVAAWSSLQPGQVANVFVTQHSEAVLAVNELCSNMMFNLGRRASKYYNELPLNLQRHASVALAALEVHDKVVIKYGGSVSLPRELQTNKKFALAAIGRVRHPCVVFHRLDDKLRNDEDIALALVSKHQGYMCDLPLALQNSREFVLKAVSVNGLCISWAAANLKQDKDVGLAAVCQCKDAFWYLAAELRCDDDIKQVYDTHNTTT